MVKINVWDVLAWVALASIVVWVTLKIIGVINTPPWLEYGPIYSAAYVAGWMVHKLKTVEQEIHEMKQFKQETIKQIHLVKENCARKS